MWFEWLFKYPRQAYEQGEWLFTGGLGAVWWVAAALLLALGVVFGRRLARWSLPRRLLVHLLQLAAAALILALLAAPALEVIRSTPGANTVAVLVDASASMALPAASIRRRPGWRPPSVWPRVRFAARRRMPRWSCSTFTTACGVPPPWPPWMPQGIVPAWSMPWPISSSTTIKAPWPPWWH